MRPKLSDEKGRTVALPPLSVVQSATLRQGWLWANLLPDVRLAAAEGIRCTFVVLACCHLDHDPFNNRFRTADRGEAKWSQSFRLD